MENNKSKKKVIKNNVKKQNNKSKKTVVKKDKLLEDKNYKLAEKYYKNSEFDIAYKEYLKLSEAYPKNKKIYKRLIETLTHNYSYKEKSKAFKSSFDDYVTTYRILSTKRELTIFEKKLSEFKNVKAKGTKSKFLLISILGFFGVHKFIEKKYILGFIYLFTLGFLGIGVLVDLISDFVEYEDYKQLDILRYIISIIILIIGLLRLNTTNYFYFMIIAIIFMPIVYSKILSLIPGFIKIIAIAILCYLGFRVEPIVLYVPSTFNGMWVTENDNTNFKSIKINTDKSTIEFNDRDKIVGTNEYDNTNKVLKVYVDDTNVYKFRIDIENDQICTYNDSKTCVISFKKETNKK